MQPNNSLTPTWYTPESEKGKDNPTQFHLKPLSGVDLTDVTAGTFIAANGEVKHNAIAIRGALNHGLIGWRGFREADGAEIPFNPAMFDRLYYDVVIELFREIVAISTFTEAARKN